MGLFRIDNETYRLCILILIGIAIVAIGALVAQHPIWTMEVGCVGYVFTNHTAPDGTNHIESHCYDEGFRRDSPYVKWLKSEEGIE